MKISVKVVPGSSKNDIVGRLGESLKVKVSAPPEKGKANKAVAMLLAKSLHMNAADIELCSGSASSQKVFDLGELTDEQSGLLAELMKN